MYGQASNSSARIVKQNATILVGGEESYELPQGKRENKVVKGGTSEILRGITGLDVFVKLAMSDTVKARIGTTEMTFDKKQIECLRDLASRIPTGKFFDGKLVVERLKNEE